MTLHAHLHFESRDCDGQYYHSHIARPTAEEQADTFGDLNFKRRIVEEIMNIVAEDGTLVVRRDCVEWHESTEEGYRTSDVNWCEGDC